VKPTETQQNAALQHIRDYYNVPAWVGQRINFDYDRKTRHGTIVGHISPHLEVLFDGSDVTEVVHPTWHVQYLAPEATS
jgi:hypothetical protein